MSLWARWTAWIRRAAGVGETEAARSAPSETHAGVPGATYVAEEVRNAARASLVANPGPADEREQRAAQLFESVPSALPSRGGSARAEQSRGGSARAERDPSLAVILEGPEEEILWSIGRHIESGRLDLPTLPSASMAVIELANHPSVEFRQIVEQISMDPVLSSELLRTSNSVLYAGVEPVDTLHSAIARIGLRALRSMILSVSMRSRILRPGALAEHAAEVWRQAYSVGSLARAIAPILGVDPEKAFLLGLLQDIGKIPLLSMLSKELKHSSDVSPKLVAQVFQLFHEEAGAAMARKWKLPAEFASVAGCHHDWQSNGKHTRSAALANLAYHLDLAYSAHDPELQARVHELPSFLELAAQPEARERILAVVEAVYGSSTASPASSSSTGSGGAWPAS
ncbi:MAG TPA: HDOD domain-containing protein [Planctomycetota bacterium]|nr:HDOD domain-containing protein [Planctomycetota bacterium]